MMGFKKITVGSVCSGIEAASVAWHDLGFKFQWFSEIATFPSNLLKVKYPDIPNLGDMGDLPRRFRSKRLEAVEYNSPDLICGGTPCQAFSLAGWKKGLEDERGNLTLKFVDIVDAVDRNRVKNGQAPAMVLWENVEGVLRDKTNAFGCFLASLAGLDNEIPFAKWPSAGLVRGPKRNIAWRVLDSKFFGLPQQRKRLYVLAGGPDFAPEKILFDSFPESEVSFSNELTFEKQGHRFEVFRAYTDCLYAAYGTKWNGNAAAYNGSLFVAQNDRLRRLTPLECERLMGFPDHYTASIPGVSDTNRYQAVGNSWSVPVIRWIGQRIVNDRKGVKANDVDVSQLVSRHRKGDAYRFYEVPSQAHDQLSLENWNVLNGSDRPHRIRVGNLKDIVDVDAAEKFYISPAGCQGILRRREERKLTINPRLERVLKKIASQWTSDEIEAVSRKQRRGRFSIDVPVEC